MTEQERRSLVVITAGLSQPSSTRLLADHLATATSRALAGHRVESDVTVVELRDVAHDMVDAMLTGVPSARLRTALDAVAGADGVIAVTPVFSASYSGLFKTFVDVLERDALDGVPVLVAATAGTARHSLVLEHAMRPLFSYLHAVVVPTAVFAASEDWGDGGDAGAGALARRVDRAAGELADAVAARPARVVTDPFEQAPSFADLLASPGTPRSH